MARIHQFARYSSPENFATNNTLLLLGRVYQLDRPLFNMFLNTLQQGTDLTVGPQFFQQKATGGIGIPDAIILQASFKLIIETKLYDQSFWGKEDYVSHFSNEDTRILLMISRDPINDLRRNQIKEALGRYDRDTKSNGLTIFCSITFSELILALRQSIEQSRSRAQLELEEILEDYEDFALSHDLITDTKYRMHVFAINDSEADNINYTLYYNQAGRRERAHRFVGLYRDKCIRYIAETKVVVIPREDQNGVINYEVLKGAEHFDKEKKAALQRFFDDQGWGWDGSVKFHLFDNIVPTNFRKTSPYGIMGPRHFDLRDYIDRFPPEFHAEWVAEELQPLTWE